MSSAEIRPATEADLPLVTEIYEHAVRYGTATFELIPPDLAEMTRRFRALMDGDFPYFVGVLDGRVVGYAYAGPIGVHARTGFQMIGTHPSVGFKFGRWLDTVMMQRALGEGATTLPADSKA